MERCLAAAASAGGIAVLMAAATMMRIEVLHCHTYVARRRVRMCNTKTGALCDFLLTLVFFGALNSMCHLKQ